MAANFETESQKIGRGWHSIQKRQNGEFVYFEGVVYCQYGMVDVYSQIGYTSMRLIFNGRLYFRSWKARFSPQGLSRLAKAFAKDIATKN